MLVKLHLNTPVPRLELCSETEFEANILKEFTYGDLEKEVFTRLEKTALNIWKIGKKEKNEN